MFDFLLNPYASQIPADLRSEIYAAEANTPAARERNTRVAGYAVAAFVGILCAFFNGFLTELRSDSTTTLEGAGFGWVQANVVYSFLLTNKIGGLLCLLGGGAAGLLAEAEFDTRRINAEQIFAEMQRRRSEKIGRGNSNSNTTSNKKKKGLSGKEQKRMAALSEVMSTEVDAAPISSVAVEDLTNESSTKEEKKGIMGTIKNFYERADSLAASQALLLNKKLEDQGLIEKITDETGLKVIGKEKAAKLQQELQQQEQQQQEQQSLVSEKKRES